MEILAIGNNMISRNFSLMKKQFKLNWFIKVLILKVEEVWQIIIFR